VSSAKTAEPIEVQSSMLSRVGPGNMYLYYMGMYKDVDAATEMGTFLVSGQLKSIVKHRILGVG